MCINRGAFFANVTIDSLMVSLFMENNDVKTDATRPIEKDEKEKEKEKGINRTCQGCRRQYELNK
jgi:hypothetical protein